MNLKDINVGMCKHCSIECLVWNGINLRKIKTYIGIFRSMYFKSFAKFCPDWKSLLNIGSNGLCFGEIM